MGASAAAGEERKPKQANAIMHSRLLALQKVGGAGDRLAARRRHAQRVHRQHRPRVVRRQGGDRAEQRDVHRHLSAGAGVDEEAVALPKAKEQRGGGERDLCFFVVVFLGDVRALQRKAGAFKNPNNDNRQGKTMTMST